MFSPCKRRRQVRKLHQVSGEHIGEEERKNREKEYVITSVSGAPKPPPHWVCKNSSWEFSFNIEVEEIHLKLLR